MLPWGAEYSRHCINVVQTVGIFCVCAGPWGLSGEVLELERHVLVKFAGYSIGHWIVAMQGLQSSHFYVEEEFGCYLIVHL